MKKLITIIVLLVSFPAIAQNKQQCKATTKAGSQCKRMVGHSLCYQHGGNKDTTVKAIYPRFRAGIIKATTDSRGLTSVVYVDKDGKQWALDYLTKQELAELIKSLRNKQ